MVGMACLSDQVFEVGVAVRVGREGEGLLLDGIEHVRDGVPLEGQAPPDPHVQAHPCRPHIHLISHTLSLLQSQQAFENSSHRLECRYAHRQIATQYSMHTNMLPEAGPVHAHR